MGLLSPTEGWNFTFYLPSGGGPGGRSWSVRDCFMFITIAGTTPDGGRVRAARVRCRWSSLRGVAGSDRRRRRVLLRLVRGGRGRGPAPSSFSPMAGAVCVVVALPILLYHYILIGCRCKRFSRLCCRCCRFSCGAYYLRGREKS